MRRVLFLMTLLILALTACAPAGAAATEEVASPDEQATPIPVDLTPAQLAAINSLSEMLSVAVDQIKLVSTEAVTWPDGCLGIVKVGVMCTQAEVPGFKIILEANGQEYEFHTNEDGSVVLSAEGNLASGVAEKTVIKQLAANLGVKESDIKVISSETVEFGDACLGVAQEGVMCAQVVTPGHIIVLEANGVQYEYHTSEDGSRVQPASLALVWKREGGIAGFCDSLTIYRSGEVYASSCNSQAQGSMGTIAEMLSPREKKQFGEWIATLGEIHLDASDPKGVADQMIVTLDFFGTGSKTLAQSQQQLLFEFAQNLYQKLAQ
jgi:hypothetical protein